MTKKFEGQARNPDTQFQIGDRVLYLPEGIYAEIDGYIWNHTIGELPRIIGYCLSCNISVSANTIVKLDK